MMHQPISQVSLSSTSSLISSGKLLLHFRVKVTHSNNVSSICADAEKSAQERAERNEKYAALAARKEALERQVREKNDDLKRLCVQEAELSGSLPLETPLEPGELPPAFRRRIGTAFTIPDNLFSDNNHKSHEVRLI
jgi:FERM domain-containing protein 4